MKRIITPDEVEMDSAADVAEALLDRINALLTPKWTVAEQAAGRTMDLLVTGGTAAFAQQLKTRIEAAGWSVAIGTSGAGTPMLTFRPARRS